MYAINYHIKCNMCEINIDMNNVMDDISTKEHLQKKTTLECDFMNLKSMKWYFEDISVISKFYIV
jgi:hypothetical protein